MIVPLGRTRCVFPPIFLPSLVIWSSGQPLPTHQPAFWRLSPGHMKANKSVSLWTAAHAASHTRRKALSTIFCTHEHAERDTVGVEFRMFSLSLQGSPRGRRYVAWLLYIMDEYANVRDWCFIQGVFLVFQICGDFAEDNWRWMNECLIREKKKKPLWP